jgi:hypothetical protein
MILGYYGGKTIPWGSRVAPCMGVRKYLLGVSDVVGHGMAWVGWGAMGDDDMAGWRASGQASRGGGRGRRKRSLQARAGRPISPRRRPQGKQPATTVKRPSPPHSISKHH